MNRVAVIASARSGVARFAAPATLLLAAAALAFVEYHTARDPNVAEYARTVTPAEYQSPFLSELRGSGAAVVAKRIRVSAPLENAWLNVRATVLTTDGAVFSSERLYLDYFVQRRRVLPWTWGLPMASAVLPVPADRYRLQLEVSAEPKTATPPPLQLEILPPVAGTRVRLVAAALFAVLGLGFALRALTALRCGETPVEPRDLSGESAAAASPRQANTGPGAQRFPFLDGLRGVAALCVLLCHLFVPAFMPSVRLIEEAWGARLPELFRSGAVGVEIFFVLSGFVIAYGIDRHRVTPGFVGRFVGRRLVRLGPPYYAALVLGLVVHASWFADSLHTTLPSFQSWKGVAINALYLHDLLGYRSPFGTVAWTLCLELQFYIVLVVGTGVSQGVGAWFSSPAGQRRAARVTWWLLLGSLAVASYAAWQPTHGNFHFLGTWFRFFLGAMVFRAVAAKESLWPCALLLVLLTVTGILLADARGVVTALTAGLILAAVYFRQLDRWLGGSFWQFLGRISYSLYISHTVLAIPLLGWAWSFMPHTAEYAIVLVGLGIFAAILTSWFMWWLVERPSVALSRRVRLKRPAPPRSPEISSVSPAPAVHGG